jgi:dUTP pyrophosphatase
MLNGKEIADNGWISNFDFEFIQQHGIDLRVNSILAPDHEKWGKIPIEGKATPLEYKPINIVMAYNGWILDPGYFAVEFMEGVKIPNDKMMMLVQRSSLGRCGASLHSGLFDAGFHTENIGAFISVHHRLIIEYHSRLAQAIFFDTFEIAEDLLYSTKGTWNNT